MSDFKLVEFGHIQRFTGEKFGKFCTWYALIGGLIEMSDNMLSLYLELFEVNKRTLPQINLGSVKIFFNP